MKKERIFKPLTISKKAEISVRSGHPWIYDAEIETDLEGIQNGSLVDIFSKKNSYLGTGIVSLNSKIRVRILSDNANETFDENFWRRRIKYAIDYRVTVMGNDFESCRLIFGEADGIPGLTVDKYNDILSVQVLSFGIDKIKDMLYRLICEELKSVGCSVSGIFERNDVAIRELEGLKQYKGWYEGSFISHPEKAVTVINENGIKYTVDIENGQKTGFFLDQKYNRLAVAKIAKGKRVLDCFTHTGSFALNAAYGGANHVTAIDVSEKAVNLARENAKLNGLDGSMDFITSDVFDLLPELCKKSDYDFIILDPPAFTKNRKTIHDAQRGYKEINYRAMKLLPRGGYLATCSCSHFMRSDIFLKTVSAAASDAGVSLKLVEARHQSPDHPILMNVSETDYLKFYIFQII